VGRGLNPFSSRKGEGGEGETKRSSRKRSITDGCDGCSLMDPTAEKEPASGFFFFLTTTRLRLVSFQNSDAPLVSPLPARSPLHLNAHPDRRRATPALRLVGDLQACQRPPSASPLPSRVPLLSPGITASWWSIFICHSGSARALFDEMPTGNRGNNSLQVSPLFRVFLCCSPAPYFSSTSPDYDHS
jgi:hypothetical protein